ncbi:MAG: methylated-DNA--[protein]-cysteine S-methyltransferase [Alphaproteobacteria bacterium]
MFCESIATPAGWLTAYANHVGLTRVEWAEAPASKANAHTQAAVQQLADYFAGKCQTFQVPYTLQGTEFQRKVWQAVAGVPYGTVQTYGEIAQLAGVNPRAARAVGAAVGANKLAVFIPCHRVVGAGGKLTGYTGGEGLKTKAYLLALEQK